jgi:hypothetical protein
MTIELMTFLGSYLLSFISTFANGRAKSSDAKFKQTLQLAGLQEESTKEARKVKDGFTKTTRRILAITVNFVFAFILLGLTAAWLDVPTFVEVTETQRGFWPFLSDKVITKFIEIKGAMYTEAFTTVILSVFGLYFGNNHAK